MHPRAAELIATLDLQPHPEGGFYRRIFESSRRVTPADDRGERAAITTTYYLLTAEIFSRWHRVRSDEVWHLYEGGPLELFELELPLRSLAHHVLGPVDTAHAPVHVIPAGQWQAARSLGAYALIGCTLGPGFDFADFKLLADDGDSAAIVRAQWPEFSFLV